MSKEVKLMKIIGLTGGSGTGSSHHFQEITTGYLFFVFIVLHAMML